MSQKPPMRSNKIAQPTRTIPTSELLRRFIPYYGPYKKIMFFDLACAALTIVCEMVLPMIMRYLTDQGMKDLASLSVGLEAAMIDGCTGIQTIIHISVPLMVSSFVQCLFLTITRCFMVYDVNLSLTKGEPFGSSVMAAMHVYNQAFTYKNYGTGQAEALILFIVCAVVGVLQVYIGKKAEVSA